MSDYVLSAKITGDSSGFEKAFSSAQKSLDTFQDKFKNISAKLGDIGGKLQGAGAKITAATIPLAMFGKKAVDYASDLQEVQNVVDVTFGNSANTINEWAKAAGNAYGQSELQAKKYNGTMGAMLKSMGLADDQVLQMSTSMTGLTGDMASFYNLPMDEAFEKIRSGISGETEPLKQLGVNMSVANLEAYALAQGITKSYDSMTQAEQATLRYNYLMQATADAQGDFTRTGDSYANQVRKMELATANLSNTVGQILLPYFLSGVQKVQEFINQFLNLNPAIQQFIVKAGMIAVVLGPALVVLGTIVDSVGSVVSVLGMLASPIGIVIGVIAALAAGFVHLYNTNETVRNGVQTTWSAIQSAVCIAVTSIKGTLANLTECFSGIWQGLSSGALTPIQALKQAFVGLGIFISSTIAEIAARFPVVGQIFERITTTLSGLNVPVLAFGALFLGMLTKFHSPLMNIANGIINFGGQIKALIPTVMSLFGSLSGGTSVFSLLKVAMSGLFSPVSLIVGGIALLIAGFATLMATNEGFRNTVLSLGKDIISSLLPAIQMIVQTVGQIISAVMPVLISLFNQLLPIIGQIITVIMQVVASLAPVITQLVGALLPVIANIITVVMNVVTAVMPAVIAIINVVMAVIQTLVPIITNILSIVISVISGIISAISPIISFVGGVITAIMAVITPIVTFIANIIATVIQVVGTVIGAVTGVFATVFSIISGIWNNICNFISTAINAIGTVISTLTGIVGGIFNSIYSIVSSIMGNVRSFITGVFDGIKSAWNGLTGFVSGVFSGVASAVSSLVNTVKGFVNKVIGGINLAVGLINKIPGVSIGKIPYLAHGTDNWQGGFAVMNESGRGELVNLPNGSQVIPHDISMQYAKESARANASAEPIDFSGFMEGMVIQIVNNTNVEGTPLKEMVSDYTIKKIGNQQKAVLKTRGAY